MTTVKIEQNAGDKTTGLTFSELDRFITAVKAQPGVAGAVEVNLTFKGKARRIACDVTLADG